MFYAMFTLVVLTFAVSAYLLTIRIAAVRRGDVKLSALRLNDSNDLPPKILQATRNYSNLFEVPLFFYVAGTVAILLHLETIGMTTLAWCFVIARIIHSWIHLTSNNVIIRFQAFFAGYIFILLMWILLVWEYSARGAQ